MGRFWVYIMTNKYGTSLYVGFTNCIERRVAEHKAGAIPGYSCLYNTNRLVYLEEYSSPRDAIEREKRIKGWTRARKIALISSINPRWDDLSGCLQNSNSTISSF